MRKYKVTTMKAHLILILFISSFYSSFGQKVIYDKTDPFSNERNISIGNSRLSNILQSGVSAKLSDSTKTFYISFITPGISGLKSETTDSTKKECKLKTISGKVYAGRWFGHVQMPIGMKLYNSSTYIFSESDFRTIANEEITDVKIDESLFETTPKHKGNLAKLCKLLLDKL